MSTHIPSRATVIIPTLNGGHLLAECIAAVVHQETPWPFEILVIDSGSTDGSLSCLRHSSIRLMSIPGHEFSHGGTRNLGAGASDSEFVVFLVGDATPCGRDWLQTMVRALEDHPEAVGGYARQRARPDADRPLRQRIEDWTPGGEGPVVKKLESLESYQRLSPLERVRMAAFDNVCSIVRRRHFIEHPFPVLPFGEDIIWGREQLLSGHSLVYIPQAVVLHSHVRKRREYMRRCQIEHTLLLQQFGLRMVPDLGALIYQSLNVIASGILRGGGGSSRQLAELMGQYLASRSEQPGT